MARVGRAEAYFTRLKSLGIHTKAHLGFLVFQGYVAELAAKSPAELTTLFEQISGSDEFKEEYDRLEREKRKAEDVEQRAKTVRDAILAVRAKQMAAPTLWQP